MTEIVHVAVAVIVNDLGQVCISFRHKDAHQGGLWEFPGGKIEQGETVEKALKREIKEELNLSILISRPLIKINYNYSDISVCLHVQVVQSYSGHTMSVEGQTVKWVSVPDLSNFNFPAANKPIITAIQLPERYLITGKFSSKKNFIYKLNNALENKIRLVQLRLKGDDFPKIKNPQQLIYDVSILCKQANAELLLNLSENWIKSIDLKEIEFSGFHSDSMSLMRFSQRPEGKLFSASCHNERELEQALQLKADFVVLSPVQKTSSHPDMDAIGWQKFSELIEKIAVPVYALGGVSVVDLHLAWKSGAQGIAAISVLWQE